MNADIIIDTKTIDTKTNADIKNANNTADKEGNTTDNTSTNTATSTTNASTTDPGERILAAGHTITNDTHVLHLNNNDLVIGPSGAGKTRGYVKPNLLQCNGSVIVTDTKGNLVREVGPVLAARGYRVACIDFTDIAGWDPSPVRGVPGAVTLGYNPLDFIRTKHDGNGREVFSEQDVMTIANALSPLETRTNDPFWDQAGAMYASAFIAYAMEFLPREDQTLSSVVKMVNMMGDKSIATLMEEACAISPDGMAARRWRSIKASGRAEKTDSSIRSILESKLAPLSFDGADRMFTRPDRVDFTRITTEKWAVFVNVSDTDRSMDRVVNLFYTQALQQLCRIADRSEGSRLQMPVRLFLDDFATNCRIPDFDKVIAVIRSREISVSVILQSLTQLEGMYGEATAASIANNCDHWLYLGGQDANTARQVSIKACRTLDAVMQMPLDKAYLFERGHKAELVSPYDLTSHPLYGELPEGGRTYTVEDAEEADAAPDASVWDPFADDEEPEL